MKSGTCPKCGSKSVHHEQNGIYIPKMIGGAFVRTDSANMGSNTDDYICVECGYMERYLDDKEKLKAIAKAWKQAT